MRSKKLGKADAANGAEAIELVHIQEHFSSRSTAG